MHYIVNLWRIQYNKLIHPSAKLLVHPSCPPSFSPVVRPSIHKIGDLRFYTRNVIGALIDTRYEHVRVQRKICECQRGCGKLWNLETHILLCPALPCLALTCLALPCLVLIFSSLLFLSLNEGYHFSVLIIVWQVHAVVQHSNPTCEFILQLERIRHTVSQFGNFLYFSIVKPGILPDHLTTCSFALFSHNACGFRSSFAIAWKKKNGSPVSRLLLSFKHIRSDISHC